MKTRLLLLCAVLLLGSGFAFAEDRPATPTGIAAIIHGRAYSQADLKVLLEEQSLYIRMTVKDEVEQKKQIAEINKHPVEFLTDRQKLMEDFANLGGSIRPEYANDMINNLISESYGNDRDKFITALARSGFTFRRFHKMVEEEVVVQVMREKQRQK